MEQATTIQNPQDGTEWLVVVPMTLRKCLMAWYHTNLIHPGITRVDVTLHQHTTWPSMRWDISNYTQPCKPCQIDKRGAHKYCKLPAKDIKQEPWHGICIDLAGPCKTTINKKIKVFHTFTILDPFTTRVKSIPIYSKKKEHIWDLIQQEWLHRYPQPARCIFDHGGKFDNLTYRKLLQEWAIPITSKIKEQMLSLNNSTKLWAF